jgi:two-component system, NarL family, invasion response regulator UvrY
VIARRAFAAGASGYVSKASPPRDLLTALAAVLRGERAMSDDIARAIAQDEVAGGRTALDELSPRELEILSLTAAGMTARAVAEALCLSVKTVHNNLSMIRAALGARTDAHLVWIAIGAGLVSPAEERPGVKS